MAPASATRSPRTRAAFAARQLGHVGVALLRHHARARRVGVVHADEAELLRRPQHDLLGQPREVQRGREAGRQELDREVAVDTASIELSNDAGEPSAAAVASGSSPSVEPASAPAPSAETSARAPAPSSVRVARERECVRQQVMAERHRLRALQMGVPRHERPGVLLRARGQRVDERRVRRASVADASFVHRRRSVTARSFRLRPACTRAPSSPEALGQHALHRDVHVLVVVRERERAVGRSAPQRGDLGSQPVGVGVSQQSRAAQRVDMRRRDREVVRE